MQNDTQGAVYLQTNDADKNEIVAYGRGADGSLARIGDYETGGRGSGEPHLPSQSSVVLSEDGRYLLVVNAGSDEITLFAVESDGLRVSDRVASGGATPTSIAVRGRLVYVLNNASASIDGFLIVTEAFGGDIGKAAASSYAIAGPGELKPVSGSVGDGRSEVCWAAVTNDGRFVFVTNFGDCTISSYSIGEDGGIELAEAVAASTRLGKAGIRDEAISSDGRFLYALDADAQQVHGWSVGVDGRLMEIGAFEGVPPTVAGLAAS
jgi:6-phosphogluconolactonase